MLALAIWTAALAAGQLPPGLPELPEGQTAHLAAEQLQYEPGKQLYVLSGHAVLSAQALELRADALEYDAAGQRAVAKGHVTMVAEGGLAAIADEIDVDLRSMEATVKGGLVMQKKGVSHEALLAAKTPDELRALGKTAAIIRGSRIRRTGPGRYEVDGLSFTPCDCKPWEPSWRVEASRADVEVGQHASMSWPRIYVGDVPVFALPWLDLPLTDRRTGLLVPHPYSGPKTGFTLEQPVFVTLGPSYDVTLTPGYSFGAPLGRDGLGVKGPRLATELRYAPSPGTAGHVILAGLFDLWPKRNPLDPTKSLDGARGPRGALELQHVQALGAGFEDRLDVSLASDAYYPRDLQTDVLLKEVQYLRSTAVVLHRGSDHYAAVDAVLRQDLGSTQSIGFALWDAIPNTLQRLPGVRLGFPERRLWGPVFGGVEVELSRLAPWRLGFGDEGTDGIWQAQDEADHRFGQDDGVFEPGEREGRIRLDLHPTLSVPLLAGRFARITPYAAFRQDLYWGEHTGTVRARGYPLAGVLAETELSRTFGGTVRHAIAPSLEVRWIPAVWGEPLGYDDEIDLAPATLRALDPLGIPVPATAQKGFLQARAQVSQALWARAGASAIRELARLDVGQDADLGHAGQPPRLGDTFAHLAVPLGPVQLGATARYDFPERALTQLTAGATLSDGRGNALSATYENLVIDGSERLRRPIDALVGPPSLLARPGAPENRAQIATVGGRYSAPFGLAASYGAIIQPAAKDLASAFVQQALGLSYGPACNCWRIEATATFHGHNLVPDLGATLTLGDLGTFGR